MSIRQHLVFDKTEKWGIFGLSFLWPCLQSSGFYPLSLTKAASDSSAASIANLHLLYSILLLAMFLLAIAMKNRLEPALRNTGFLLTIGIGGTVGQAVLVLAEPAQPFFTPLAIAALPFIACFIAASVTAWGGIVSRWKGRRVLASIALSYLASQAGLTLCYAMGLPTGTLLCTCSACTALCAAASIRAENNTETQGHFNASKTGKIPLGAVALSVSLVYFCIIYVRLLIPEFQGDATPFYKFASSILGAVVFTGVLLHLSRNDSLETNFVVLFVFLTSIYVIGLAAMSLTSGAAHVLSRRILIAGEHGLEVFLFMVATVLARESRRPTVPFGIFGVIVIVLPWILSFDLKYLTNMGDAISSSPFLEPVATVVLCAIALCTMAFLLSRIVEAKTASTEPKARQFDSAERQEAVNQALSNLQLTEREAEVAFLVFRGHSAKRIAEELYLSEATIKAYTSRVYRKAGIHSKQELIALVEKNLTDSR